MASEERKQRRKERRRQNNIDKEYRRTQTCDECGGEMSWCVACKTFTRNCCVPYGTCACS